MNRMEISDTDIYSTAEAGNYISFLLKWQNFIPKLRTCLLNLLLISGSTRDLKSAILDIKLIEQIGQSVIFFISDQFKNSVLIRKYYYPHSRGQSVTFSFFTIELYIIIKLQ